MRKYSLLFSLVGLSIANSPTCDPSMMTDNSWYTAMVYCAWTATGSVTTSSLHDCLTSTNGAAILGNTVVNYLEGSSGGDCLQCVTNAVESIRVRLDAPNHTPNVQWPNILYAYGCPARTVAWNAPDWFRTQCIRWLFDQLNDFNTCASNGKDVVYGQENRRCSVRQNIDLQKEFNLQQTALMLTNNPALPVTIYNWTDYDQPNRRSVFESYPCSKCWDLRFQAFRYSNDTAVPELWRMGMTSFDPVILCSGGHTYLTETKPFRLNSTEEAVFYVDTFRSAYGVAKDCFLSSAGNYTIAYGCIQNATGLRS